MADVRVIPDKLAFDRGPSDRPTGIGRITYLHFSREIYGFDEW